MTRIKRLLITLLVLFLFKAPGHSQTEEMLDLTELVEEITGFQEHINYDALYEQLLSLHQNPIDLNHASPEGLRSTYLLSDLQITHLLKYISEKGKLLTLYELQLIEGFDFTTIQNLLPFVTINPGESTKDQRPLIQKILKGKNSYLIARYERVLENKEGYDKKSGTSEDRYVGSPEKYYLRYRSSRTGDFSAGFTMEKDPGEAITWESATKRYGMDFWSAHLLIENRGKIKKAIIGDYQLQFGQGLVLGSAFSFGKGSETINTLQRFSFGIKPYTAATESGFFRGTAGTFRLGKKIQLTGFYSNLGQDANLQLTDSLENNQPSFTAFQTTGMHRTPDEIKHRKKVTNQSAGIIIQYKTRYNLEVGASWVYNYYNHPLKKGNQPYNAFAFEGRENFNAGFYSNYRWKEFSFFGEAALSKSGGIGAIAGFTATINPRIALSMLLRNYEKDFHSIRGTAFGESTQNVNEKGIYWGLKYTLNKKLYLTAYYDTYQFPWLKYNINTPSGGNDYLIRINYHPKETARFYMQIRSETKDAATPGTETNQKIVMPGTKNQLLANLDLSISERLSAKSRIQYSDYHLNGEKTTGYAFVQDLNFGWKKWRFSSRIVLFDTEGNQNKQYAYEKDVLYAFSIPAYSGQGIRNYLLVQYKANSKISFWARMARTTYNDRKVIGNGRETIQGNQRTEIKFQIRYKL